MHHIEPTEGKRIAEIEEIKILEEIARFYKDGVNKFGYFHNLIAKVEEIIEKVQSLNLASLSYNFNSFTNLLENLNSLKTQIDGLSESFNPEDLTFSINGQSIYWLELYNSLEKGIFPNNAKAAAILNIVKKTGLDITKHLNGEPEVREWMKIWWS